MKDLLIKLKNKIKNRLGLHERVVVKGTGIAFMGMFFLSAASFCVLFAKTRLMPASDVGALVLAKSIVLVAFVLNSGFSGAVFRYASVFRGEEDKEKVKGVVLFAYKYAIPIFFITAVLVSSFAPYIALRMFHKPELCLLIRILPVMVLMRSIINVNISLLRSKYMVQYRYIFDIGEQVLMLLFVFILFLSGRKDFLLMFAVSWTTAAIFVMVRSFFVVKREFSFVFDKSIKKQSSDKKMFLYSFISQLTGILIRFRLDVNIFIMGFFLLDSDIALYNVAFQIGMAAAVLLEGLNSIFPAVVGNLYGKDKIREIKALHKKTALILGCVALCIFLVFMFLGKYLLCIFGVYYKEAYLPLLIIAFSFIVESGIGSAGMILNMMGKPHYNTACAFVSLILTVILCYSLIPVYGVTGAAIAFSVSNIVKRLMMLASVLFLYRKRETEQLVQV